MAEPQARSKHKQITLINAYIIPKLSETRLQFLNRFDEMKDRAVKQEYEKYAKTAAYFHRDTLPRIDKVFRRALGAIVTSTEYLKDRNIYFAGPSGVGKSRHITKFVEEVAGHPVDLHDIVYGTDNIKLFLREEFPTCQDFPSFTLALAMRHALETAVKTRAVGGCYFLQEGGLAVEELILNLLKDTKQLEIRDFDAPFKTISIRALNREHHRGERPIDFDNFARLAGLCRKTRTALLNNLTDGQSYVMNYDGVTLTAAQMKEFDYKEPETLSVIGDEVITEADVSPFGPDLRDYVGLTIRQAFGKVNERTVQRGAYGHIVPRNIFTDK